ncbi:hypothetical protein [Alloactinosynnema sp. L-07]|uniref:hypothetical protein n=1 Tax=Alloactinosynnema sp. L-07 TaxID=1653480 RepID=UPI00065EFA3E|nr:hypothetical protein [Alloactinosynnema sp. L-07]CRK60761.1 hypothetical protein [Alloactinosynnema sp. L-07]
MSGSRGRAMRLGGGARRALTAARALEDVVADQLPVVSLLPEESRRRGADYLAELVMLAQAYRHFARGWISRRELEHRARRTTERLAEMRQNRPIAAHLTEQD